MHNLYLVSLSLLVALLWSISPIIYKHSLSTISQSTLIVVSGLIYFIASAAYFFLHKTTIIKELSSPKNTGLLWLLVVANIAVFVGQVIYIFTIEKGTSYAAVALASASPLFVLLLSYLFLREEITFKHAIAVVIIVIGIMLLVH